MKTVNLKNLAIILMLQILFVVSVQAQCNLELFRFGSSLEDVKERYPESMIMLDIPGMSRSVMSVSGKTVCPYDSRFYKTSIKYVFLYGRLVEVNVLNFTDKPILIDWVESAYGKKANKPKGMYGNDPNVQLLWDKHDVVVLYNLQSNGSEKIEQVYIQSKRHKNLHQKLSTELEGEW
jgi:hypothetical protein